jgi:hypothetical protein
LGELTHFLLIHLHSNPFIPLPEHSPCFVKRYRNTRSGKKIFYEEEHRPSWCRNYGVENQCIVDKKMYEKYNFLQLTGTKILSDDWGDCGIAHITNDCELYWDCC